MRIKWIEVGLGLTLTVSLFLVATGQSPAKVKKQILAMRKQADRNARTLATFVQARAVKTGSYDNNMVLYAKDFGGEYPINPCTGTPTGYTMAVMDNGKAAGVAVIAGKNCGTWTPIIYHLKLK